MGGTTASGFPYVTPDDHPLQYPAASQALANKLEASVRQAASATRSADGTVAANATANVASVTLASAVGRVCWVYADLTFSNTAATALWLTLRNGSTVVRQVGLASVTAYSTAGDSFFPLATLVIPATATAFSFEAMATVGSLTVKTGSAIHVLAL